MVIASKQFSWWCIYMCVAVTYFISHGLMLLLYGAWWDDMLQWNVSPQMLEGFLGADNFNNPFIYYPIKWIATIEDTKLMTFVYRLVSFMCWFLSVTSFFFVVKKLTNNKSFTLYSSLIAASCGLNKCMILICCYHYSISIALFMLGLVLFTYDYYKRNRVLIYLVSILWTLSLIVWRSAVLVIPACLLIAVISTMKVKLKDWTFYCDVIKKLIKFYWPIIIGLMIFAILYKTILAPKGEYSVYYSIRIKYLFFSPITTLVSSCALILGYLSELFSVFALDNSFVTGAIFVVVTIFWILLYKLENRIELYDINRSLLLVSCIILFFSMMPHLLREFVLSFDLNGYKSRITALSVFPLSMFVAFLIYHIKNIQAKRVLLSSIIVLSMGYSIKTYLNYENGWLKNEALTEFFTNNKFLKGRNIICIDNSQEYSPFQNEVYRFYDYEGCAKLAYGFNDSTKCCDLTAFGNYKRFEEPDYYLIIDNKANGFLGHKAMYLRLFDESKYRQLMENLLMFRIETKEEFEVK